MEVSGRLVVGRDMHVVEGTVVVDDGRIAEVREEDVESDDVVLPAFVDAHTHVGDSIAKEAGRGLPLEELVAPPNGLKHRLLAEASRGDKIAAMERTVEEMERGGVGAFLDFREGGVDGVEMLREAVDSSDVEAVAFGRGDADVLDVADGYGASGALDDDFEEERRAARNRGKPFAIHAGEGDAEDVDPALELEPDHLVHLVHARERHLDWLEDTDTPVVVCPRCNQVTDVGLPPVDELVDATTVALGTDNAMLNSPSMWREMEFVSKIYDVDDREVLRMATEYGADVAGLDDAGVLEEGARARLTVLRGDRSLADVDDVVAGVVRRAGEADVRRSLLR